MAIEREKEEGRATASAGDACQFSFSSRARQKRNLNEAIFLPFFLNVYTKEKFRS